MTGNKRAGASRRWGSCKPACQLQDLAGLQKQRGRPKSKKPQKPMPIAKGLPPGMPGTVGVGCLQFQPISVLL